MAGKEADLDALEKHFYRRVKKDGQGCWIWQGGWYEGVDESHSYPRINKIGLGTRNARTASWILAGGMASDGPFLPSCGNPRCVNPDHLGMVNTVNENEDSEFAARLELGFLMSDLTSYEPPSEPEPFRAKW